jgi:hypothetical protein
MPETHNQPGESTGKQVSRTNIGWKQESRLIKKRNNSYSKLNPSTTIPHSTELKPRFRQHRIQALCCAQPESLVVLSAGTCQQLIYLFYFIHNFIFHIFPI